MKIIHRSILKELSLTFVISLACLNFILMMEKLLRLTRFLSGVGTSMTDMVKLVLFIQPQLFLLTIPMSLLLSSLLVYGRLNIDNELVILRSSGMNFGGISRPVLVLGFICFLLNIAVSFYIGPWSSIALRQQITNIIRVRTPLAIEEGRFNTYFKNTLIIVKEKVSDNELRGIFIYDSKNKQEPKVVMAKEGKIFEQEGLNIDFLLKDGYINMTTGDSMTELFFKKYNLMLHLDTGLPDRKIAELTPPQLLEKIGRVDRHQALSSYLELDRRLSLPFLCIVLIFFGPSLSLLAGRSGKLGGLTLGLAVFTVYYMLLIYGENLVRADKIPHYIGAWAPTIILGVFAMYMYHREHAR